MVEKVAVMLSRSVEALPAAAGWAFEPKLDGFRCLLAVSEFGDVRLESRPGKALTRYFPEVTAAAPALPAGVVLDGELVVPRGAGVDFTALQHRLHPQHRPARRSSSCIVPQNDLVGNEQMS